MGTKIAFRSEAFSWPWPWQMRDAANEFQMGRIAALEAEKKGLMQLVQAILNLLPKPEAIPCSLSLGSGVHADQDRSP